MEVKRSCCNLASLVVLVILMFPVTCLSTGDTNKPPRERSENKILRRFYPTDYDDFVGLLGKRHAASALNYADHILADLLKQETAAAGCGSVQTFLQKTGFEFSDCVKQRRRRSVMQMSNIRV